MFNSVTERTRRRVTAWRNRRTAKLLAAIDDKQVYETSSYESYRENDDGTKTLITRSMNRLYQQNPPLAVPGEWVSGKARLWHLTNEGRAARAEIVAAAKGGAR